MTFYVLVMRIALSRVLAHGWRLLARKMANTKEVWSRPCSEFPLNNWHNFTVWLNHGHWSYIEVLKASVQCIAYSWGSSSMPWLTVTPSRWLYVYDLKAFWILIWRIWIGQAVFRTKIARGIQLNSSALMDLCARAISEQQPTFWKLQSNQASKPMSSCSLFSSVNT